MITHRLPWVRSVGLAAVTAAAVAGCAGPGSGNGPDDEALEGPGLYPEIVWTNGSGEPRVAAIVVADADPTRPGGGHVVEVIVDTREAESPIRVGDVTLGGPTPDDGEREQQPVVSAFGLDCGVITPGRTCDTEATVEPDEVQRLRFRGAWPADETIASVDIDLSPASGPSDGPDPTDGPVELTQRPIGPLDSCAPEHGADLLATAGPDAVVLERRVETEPRPDAPPALRTEIRTDGSVTSWDPEAQQYDHLAVPLRHIVDLLEQAWSTGCGLEGTHFALPEVTHVAQTIRVLGPDGDLHDIVWDTDPPSGVAELADIVATTLSPADLGE